MCLEHRRTCRHGLGMDSRWYGSQQLISFSSNLPPMKPSPPCSLVLRWPVCPILTLIELSTNFRFAEICRFANIEIPWWKRLRFSNSSAHPTSGGPYFWAAMLSRKKNAAFASWITGTWLLITWCCGHTLEWFVVSNAPPFAGWFNLLGQVAVTTGIRYVVVPFTRK